MNATERIDPRGPPDQRLDDRRGRVLWRRALHCIKAVLPAALIGLTAFCLGAPAFAQNIYMWTDEDGIQHFSDREPEDDLEVTVQRAVAEPEAPVHLTNIGTEREPEWALHNRLHGPVTVRVRLDQARNVVSDPDLPALVEVPGQDSKSIVLGPLDPRLGWGYRIEMSSVPGLVNAVHDPDFQYQAPIPKNITLRIGQGFNGRFTHQQPHSRYAVDIPLAVGTPILAARAGRVMDVERYFHQNGQDRERHGPRANYVRIVHTDGSMAVYAHLDYDAVLVRPGQQVEAGTTIARSGNTGFSTGPHLHFAVQVNRDMQLISVPFSMVDGAGRPVELRRSQSKSLP
ncbi:MAG: peptidoglycan DD-metalloendopeptidase family protein [Wenzhouxiangellaceae bacterium]